jgi:elongation factor Ts
MEITAKMVKELRDKTGAGMMDCKKALGKTDGDVDKAVTVLREQGIAKASSKAGRATTEGAVVPYIHPGDKLGVLVEIDCETDFVARTDAFKIFARNVAMHVAASAPLCVQREDVDKELVENERQIFKVQAEKDGKPANIIEKIIEGKIEKYYSEIVLLEQPYVKDTDMSVGDLVKETIGTLGENILIKRFTRFRLGE